MESHYEYQHTQQIADMVNNHLLDLNTYLDLDSEYAVSIIPNKIATLITKSEEILSQNTDTAETTTYWIAIECLHHLRTFFTLIGQELDADFLNSQLGRLYSQLIAWCKNAQPDNEMAMVWEMLHPAQPDVLEQVDIGIYEARWWKPVPAMDIEIIKGTCRIHVTSEPYEPDNLPQGLALRFTICNE